MRSNISSTRGMIRKMVGSPSRGQADFISVVAVLGGAGSAGTWDSPRPKRPLADRRRTPGVVVSVIHQAPAKPAANRTSADEFRTVIRNGYTYQIDSRERTRRVSGILTIALVPSRSRTSQRQAGGIHRRRADDSGHYIAARFSGPTEAFNHFAQDARFNRGDYRALEDEWARERRAGKTFSVKIIPRFDHASQRPFEIDV